VFGNPFRPVPPLTIVNPCPSCTGREPQGLMRYYCFNCNGSGFISILPDVLRSDNDLVKTLAQQMRAGETGVAPILADALEERGEAYQPLYKHLRTPLHCSACWVPTLLVG